MATRVAGRLRHAPRASVDLPEPVSPSTQTSRPPPSSGRLGERVVEDRGRRRRAGSRPRRSERQPAPAVGRHLSTMRSPASRWTSGRARTPRRTWRAGTTPGHRSAVRGAPGPVSGVCTSPAPSSEVRWRPGRRPGDGQPVPPGGARGDEPAAVHGRDPARRTADDGDAVERRRARLRTTRSGRTAPGRAARSRRRSR